MTNTSTMRRGAHNRMVLSSALVAFCLAITACSSNTEPAAVVEIGTAADEPSAVNEPSDTAGTNDDLEYGDSIAELNHATGQRVESTVETLPGFRSVEWDDLIPPGRSSGEILARYEAQLMAAEPGSAEIDAIYQEMNDEFNSVSVNPQLDSEDVQLAGFVAPLTYDGDSITEFLLVPYFGACIHVPAPASNQTVMVTLEAGESLSLEDSWGAVWVAGEMAAATTDTELATAGYSISNAQFGVYGNQ